MRWRIDNIPTDARGVAQAAARAAGLSTAAWLERAIRDATRGVDQRRATAQPSLPFPAGGIPALSQRASDISMATRDIRDGPSPEPAAFAPHIAAPATQAAADTTAAAIAEATDAGASGVDTAALGATANEAAAAMQRPRPGGRSPARATPVGKPLLAAVAAALIVASLGVAAWLFWPDQGHDGDPLIAAIHSEANSGAEGDRTPDATTPNAATPGTAAGDAAAVRTPEEAMADLQRQAEAGDPLAQHDLALAYVGGRGVPQNYAIAAQWFEKSAAGGSERAQFNLAVLYENALGVSQDFARAFSHYLAAAELGFPPAQHNVGVAYARGRGTAVDYRAATLWFRRAADHGIAPAQFNLGMIYEQGLAGPPDPETALGWYRRAAAGGSQEALARLTILESRVPPPASAGKGKPAKLTAAGVAEVQRLLTKLAFRPGPADGKVGRATRDAIRDYQRVAGLTMTGEATADLLDHLRQVVGMMETSQR